MKSTLIFSYLFLCSFFVLAQQPTIILTKDMEMTSIGKKISYFEDNTGELSINDVIQPENQTKFIESKEEILKLEQFASAYWVKINLNNQSGQKDWLLEIAEAKIVATSLFYRDSTDKWVEIKNGYSVPMHQKAKRHQHQIFPLYFKANSAEFYIKIKGTVPNIPIRVLKNKQYEVNLTYENLTHGLFYGIILFIIFNNLAFGLLSRNKTYLIYTGLVINYMIVSLFDGYIRILIDRPIDLLLWASFTAIINIIFMVLYAKNFLNVKSNSTLGKVLNLFLVGIATIGAVSLFMDSYTVFMLSQILLLFAFILVIVTAITSLKREGQFAIYYLVTFAIFAVFVIIEILYINTGSPTYFLHLPHGSWGILSEVTILAYALNKKFDFDQRQLQKAKEQAQKEMLEQVTENARLVEEQNEILEEKVKTRTIELYQSNEELAATNEELYQTQEEILAQRDLLEKKNNLLEQYTHKIGKSIEAAQMIQKAILPPKDKMAALFQEHFVLFMPKDIVSGDFWWANEINGEKYLIVADCTGHGVSGAMLTMIGSALLDRIISLMGTTDPAEILTKLHEEIKAVLQQDQTKNNEGMDIAITHWHYENEDCVLSFAAAKRPLLYAYEGKIEKIGGSRRNIGGIVDSIKTFETKTFTLSKGTCLYLCSDGYGDQNDVKRHNFSEKRMINLLQEIQNLDMESQKEVLQTQLVTHMEGTEQRDDILVIGVRI